MLSEVSLLQNKYIFFSSDKLTLPTGQLHQVLWKIFPPLMLTLEILFFIILFDVKQEVLILITSFICFISFLTLMLLLTYFKKLLMLLYFIIVFICCMNYYYCSLLYSFIPFISFGLFWFD